MRTWIRTLQPRLCGRCGALVKRGEAMVELRLLGVQLRKWRCAACADMPVPTLPPLLERAVIAPIQTTAPMKKLATVIPFALEQWERDQKEPK